MTVDTPSPLIPASTVILLREHAGELETLMLRRNRSLKAFGGAWVFPGGRVDAADGLGRDDEMTCARTAACRETQEETGLNIERCNLVSLSLWIPPVQEKRRFSTRFFLAAAPDAPVKIDDGEIHDFEWLRPKDIIANTPDPNRLVMPPTYVSLHDLCAFNSVDAALAGIAKRADEIFETRFMRTDTGFATLWDPDAAYAGADLDTPGPRRRLLTSSEGWEYQKDF